MLGRGSAFRIFADPVALCVGGLARAARGVPLPSRRSVSTVAFEHVGVVFVQFRPAVVFSCPFTDFAYRLLGAAGSPCR